MNTTALITGHSEASEMKAFADALEADAHGAPAADQQVELSLARWARTRAVDVDPAHSDQAWGLEISAAGEAARPARGEKL